MSGFRCLHRQDVSAAVDVVPPSLSSAPSLSSLGPVTANSCGSSSSETTRAATTAKPTTATTTSSAVPIWNIMATPMILSSTDPNNSSNQVNDRRCRSDNMWRVWSARGDGWIQAHVVEEKDYNRNGNINGNNNAQHGNNSNNNHQDNDLLLDASALKLTCTHLLSPSLSVSSQNGASLSNSSSRSSLGITQLSVIRNKTSNDGKGHDDADWIVAGLDLAGRACVWTFPHDWDSDHDAVSNSSTNDSKPIQFIPAHAQWDMPDATGTTAVLCPLHLARFLLPPAPSSSSTKNDDSVSMSANPILLAVGCLDGTVHIVSTGIAEKLTTSSRRAAGNNKINQQSDHHPTRATGAKIDTIAAITAGTVVDVLSSPGGSAIPTILCWQPMIKHQLLLAIGRMDGTIDFVSPRKQLEQDQRHHHHHHQKLIMPLMAASAAALSSSSSTASVTSPCPIRAMAFTNDGQLFMAGNDAGHLAVWDVGRCCYQDHDSHSNNSIHNKVTGNNSGPSSRSTSSFHPVLVHHIIQAHTGWILHMVALDERRFVTTGTDKWIRVWHAGQMNSNSNNGAVHSFQTDHTVWTIDRGPPFATTTATAVDESRSSSSSTSKPMKQLTKQQPRLVAGSERGWINVYSLESL